VLRTGSAGSNTAADHIEATRLSLAQLPRHLRRRVLVRTDSGGGTHGFLDWLTGKSRRLHYSAGMTITEDMQDAILKIPADAWTPAYDGDGQVRDGVWVTDITGMLDLSSWSAGMRVIVRKERPHPGAQLRFTDIDGHRFTAFATDAKKGQLADLELGHRRLARCEDRIPLRQGHRPAEPPAQGLRPESGLVRDRRAGLRAAGLDPDARPGREARRWEPKRLRLRLFSAAGRLVRGGRRLRPPPAAPPRPALALGRPDHRRGHPPASHSLRLTSQNRHHDTEGATPRACGTPPSRRDRRAASHGPHMKIITSRKGGSPRQPRERSRLAAAISRLNLYQSI
jgi:hypothetical protein